MAQMLASQLQNSPGQGCCVLLMVRCSLVGKMVVPLPEASVAGYSHVVAICPRGTDISKVRVTNVVAIFVQYKRIPR